MTNDEIKAIEARHQKATPGPWNVEHEKCRGDYHYDCRLRCDNSKHADGSVGFEIAKMSGAGGRVASDVDFIAYARTDIPDLVAHVRKLEAESARLADWGAGLRAALDDLATKASIVVSSEFGGNDPEEGPHCVQQLDLAIDQARRLILAAPAPEAVELRERERELDKAARELADLAATWFPTANECVAYRSLRAQLAAKEGA